MRTHRPLAILALAIALSANLLTTLTHSARAGTITQIFTEAYVDNQLTFAYFNQFNPSVGTLLSVTGTVSGTFNYATLDLTNPTSSPITASVDIAGPVETDFGNESFGQEVIPTVQPGGTVMIPFGGTVNITGSAVQPLSYFVGTGIRQSQFFPNISITVNDGMFQEYIDESTTSVDYTETLTYTYGPVSTAPEPASIVMMATGLAAIGLVAWRRRPAA